jgi:hypothetical protein
MVLSSDASSAHGKRPHGLIFDELHGYSGDRDRELFEALKKSLIKRRQPLLIMITHSGTDDEGICHEEYEYAKACAGRHDPRRHAPAGHLRGDVGGRLDVARGARARQSRLRRDGEGGRRRDGMPRGEERTPEAERLQAVSPEHLGEPGDGVDSGRMVGRVRRAAAAGRGSHRRAVRARHRHGAKDRPRVDRGRVQAAAARASGARTRSKPRSRPTTGRS